MKEQEAYRKLVEKGRNYASSQNSHDSLIINKNQTKRFITFKKIAINKANCNRMCFDIALLMQVRE